MDLQHYIDIFRRRAMTIAIVTALTAAVVVIAGFVLPPIYTSSATVRIILDVGVTDTDFRETYGERLMDTYARILMSRPVLEGIAKQLSMSATFAQLSDKVKVDVIPNTELMTITVHDNNPTTARDFANGLVAVLVEQAKSAYSTAGKSSRQVLEEQLAAMQKELENDRQQLAAEPAGNASETQTEALTNLLKIKEDAYARLLNNYELARMDEALRTNSVVVVEPATLPKIPSNALGLTEIGLGFVVGLVGGIGLALVLENLDTSIHSPQQAESLTHLPLLGVVPRGLLAPGSSGKAKRASKRASIAESYRLLSINLQSLGRKANVRTILITSATPREGKTTVAANLAQILAESCATVFLIEGNLRRPTVGKLFCTDGKPGLSSLLAEPELLNGETLGEVLYHADERPTLFVLGGGSTPPNPAALLTSPAMDKLIADAGAQAQTTLFDAPAVLGLPDVSILAPKADGVILVVAQGFSRQEQVQAALKQLEAIQARVLGLIFVQ